MLSVVEWSANADTADLDHSMMSNELTVYVAVRYAYVSNKYRIYDNTLRSVPKWQAMT
jgi:hypothetical protein